MKSNVLLLTTDCTFRCRYCYQRQDRDKLTEQRKLTKSEIESFLQEVHQREGDTESVIVIFGGEPLMEMELVEHVITVGRAINPKFRYSITTNGELLGDEDTHRRVVALHQGGSLKLEISYDASGHHYRVRKDGSPSEAIVEAAITRAIASKLAPVIRYTITRGNYEAVVRDTVLICEKFKGIAGIIYNIEGYARDKGVLHLHARLKELGRRYGVTVQSYDLAGFLDSPGSNAATYQVPGNPTPVEYESPHFDLFTR